MYVKRRIEFENEDTKKKKKKTINSSSIYSTRIDRRRRLN